MAEYDEEELVAQVVGARDERLTHWAAMILRHQHIEALVSNHWDRVFPNDGADMLEPMVGNIFRHTIEDGGRLFAEATPTERVPQAGVRDQSRADDREMVMAGYTQRSGSFEILEYHGQDMIAAGFTAIKTWPTMGLPPEQRFPTFRRLKPRNVLPEPRWAPDRPTDEVIHHYTESIYRLRAFFPEQTQTLLDKIERARQELHSATSRYDPVGPVVAGTPAEVEIIEDYCSRYVAKVALYSDETSGLRAGAVLSYVKNNTGLCPVQIAYRPTWSDEPLGDLDDSKGIVRTRSRYMRLLLDYFVDMVYGGKLVWNVKNPHERGPGQVFYGMGPDAKMESVTPNVPSFQALQVLGLLDHEARGPSNPLARENELDLNKATAAYLSGAQAPLRTVVRSLQRNWAVAKRHSNEVAFAQDEAWCNTRKTIVGIARGRRFKLDYTPSETIRGDYANIVSYGAASGLDLPTQQVLTNQKVQLKMLSVESALEQDPSTEDVGLELARIATGRFRDSLTDGVALPTTPLDVRARAFQAMRAAKNVDEGLDEVAKIAATPAPAPAVPGAPPGLTPPGAPLGPPGAEQPAPTLPPVDLLRRLPGRR